MFIDPINVIPPSVLAIGTLLVSSGAAAWILKFMSGVQATTQKSNMLSRRMDELNPEVNRMRTDLTRLQTQVDGLDERVETGEEKFSAMAQDFVPRNEIDSKLKTIHDSQLRNEEWLKYLVLGTKPIPRAPDGGL